MSDEALGMQSRSWPIWLRIVLFVFVVVALTIAALGFSKSKAREEPTVEAAVTSPTDFMTVLDKAKAGDYQAQRNLAYGFASAPYPGQEENRVLACAWYLVVVNSNHPQADSGDVSNANTYCGSLDTDLLDTAKHRATQFLAEITATQKLTKLP